MSSNGKSKKKGKGQKSEKIYRKVGSILKSQHFDGNYVKVDDYAGDLIFRDKKSETFFKVKQLSMFDPDDEAPNFVISNLVINLASKYDVKEMAGEEAEDEADDSSEEEDESEQESKFSKRKK